ncbi:serine/threonine-protein kinase 33-like isoform X2 [Watersipora subatra]|uniref:serine/threonine-protein kinase 33-like isoform X2 n=1 Tax=Watersipora subatra TaxID=2589382 RepID=UPI00355C2776
MSTIPVNKRPSHMDKPSPIPHTRVDDEAVIESMFSMGKKLGQGSFGIVREAVDINTGKKWAVKAVNKEKAGSSAVKLLEREVSILKRVNHHHIIHLEQVFETSKKMYLVMELCEHGEIADMLKTQLYFKEDEARKIIGDLASAISYLHKNDIVHRDLKLENILVHKNEESNDLHIKVTDFGLSVVKDGVGHESMMQQFCGTPIYMPPEIVDNKTYSQQCDVWAMGVITYYLLAGSPPFRARDEETLYEYIKKGEINFKENYIRDCSPAAHQCIQGMLKVDPAHRFTASEVLNHQWITGIHNGTTRGNVLELMKQWKDDLGEENEFERSETTLSVPVESIDQISHCNLQDGPAEKSPHKATVTGKKTSALTSLPSSQKSNTAVRKKADKSPPSQTMKPINRK